MSEVIDDISLVDGSSVSKCIKGIVCLVFGVNVGWYMSRNVSASVDNDVFVEIGSGNDGWAKLIVENEVYFKNDISVYKYVNI